MGEHGGAAREQGGAGGSRGEQGGAGGSIEGAPREHYGEVQRRSTWVPEMAALTTRKQAARCLACCLDYPGRDILFYHSPQGHRSTRKRRRYLIRTSRRDG